MFRHCVHQARPCTCLASSHSTVGVAVVGLNNNSCVRLSSSSEELPASHESSNFTFIMFLGLMVGPNDTYSNSVFDENSAFYQNLRRLNLHKFEPQLASNWNFTIRCPVIASIKRPCTCLASSHSTVGVAVVGLNNNLCVRLSSSSEELSASHESSYFTCIMFFRAKGRS